MWLQNIFTSKKLMYVTIKIWNPLLPLTIKSVIHETGISRQVTAAFGKTPKLYVKTFYILLFSLNISSCHVSLRSSVRTRKSPFWNKLFSVNKFKYVSTYMILHFAAFKVLWKVDSKRNLLNSCCGSYCNHKLHIHKWWSRFKVWNYKVELICLFIYN